MNSTTRFLHLPRGTAVAECSVIPKYPELPQDSESQSTADLQVRSTVAEQDEFPAISLGSEAISPIYTGRYPRPKKRLISIFDEYRVAFSLNGELGFTNLFLHRINTGDATPNSSLAVCHFSPLEWRTNAWKK